MTMGSSLSLFLRQRKILLMMVKHFICIGDCVSFHDLEGTEHKLKFAWFLSPELKELKEYFANYKRVNRLQQIDKCKDDIERYKVDFRK